MANTTGTNRQLGNGAESCKGSRTMFRNFVNFGPQKLKNMTRVYTDPRFLFHCQSTAHAPKWH